MKRKKLISSAVAGMLIAAQMVMPVAADATPAPDGKVDVTVELITPVIRVEVPTALAVAVNQFEKNDAGSQIKSGEFNITNKSEVPVRVTVNSTLTASGVTLTETKKEAEESEDENDAWLAVAAQVAAGKYVAGATTNIVRDLTEANKNVATFTGTDTKTAKQIFYLAKAKPATGATTLAVTYKAIKVGGASTDDGVASKAAAKKEADKVTYTKFYEMTEYDSAGDGSGTKITSSSTVANLETVLKTTDLYEIKDDATAVKFYAKGTTTTNLPASIPSGVKYYTMAADATLPANFDVDKIYVYGETANGGNTAFRYIGKLSPAKDVWTSDDISEIAISYKIDGISEDRYNAMTAVCSTTGLYESLVGKAVNGPSVMNNAATPTAMTLKTAIGSRLKSANPTLQFVMTAAQLLIVKTESLTLQKVNVKVTGVADAVVCTATAEASNPNPAANTDGNLYKITGDMPNTMTSVDYIEALYGVDGSTDGPYMTVKYTFQ